MSYTAHIEWQAHHHPREYPTDPAEQKKARLRDAVADFEAKR